MQSYPLRVRGLKHPKPTAFDDLLPSYPLRVRELKQRSGVLCHHELSRTSYRYVD